MVWIVNCTNENCGEVTSAINIVELLNNCRNEEGWFICNACNSEGYIEKSFNLQEPGEVWAPNLIGALRLNEDEQDTYQPFVFLVSDNPNMPPNGVWFCYYKDTRLYPGGRLMLGHGPGGPPVLSFDQVRNLVEMLNQIEAQNDED